MLKISHLRKLGRKTWKQPRCPLADEQKKKLWGTEYNVMLLSHKKGMNLSRTEVDETRACYTEQSISESGKQISCINTDMHTHTYVYVYMSHLGGSVVENLPAVQEMNV